MTRNVVEPADDLWKLTFPDAQVFCDASRRPASEVEGDLGV